VLFTGSNEVGTRIKQDTLQQHWKLTVLQMGGKNSSIVWEDAELEHAVYQTLSAAYLTAGQSCHSTSRIIVHTSILDSFLKLFHKHAKAFSIGHPFDNPYMGPLIDSASVDRYMKFLGIASREGFEVLMRGKVLELNYSGNYVTPSICVSYEPTLEQTKKSVFQQTEILAPSVAILGVHDLDEAIAQANATQFGLSSSVFCKSKKVFDKCYEDLETGLINWNLSTIETSARLPLQGLGKSGNHFSSNWLAPFYCTVPTSSLEVAEPCDLQLKTSLTPGLHWN